MISIEQALLNIRTAVRVYRGTADEHQALAESLEVIAKALEAAKEQKHGT